MFSFQVIFGLYKQNLYVLIQKVLSKWIHNNTVNQTDAGAETMKMISLHNKHIGWELIRSVLLTNAWHSIVVETGGFPSLFFWFNEG